MNCLILWSWKLAVQTITKANINRGVVKLKTINPILNTFITGDCEQVLKEIPSDSIDFVLTSPPYADKRDYGNENSSISPDEYVEWFLPKGREIYRVLKPTGSFILNISDKVVDGFHQPHYTDLKKIIHVLATSGKFLNDAEHKAQISLDQLVPRLLAVGFTNFTEQFDFLFFLQNRQF